MMNSSQPPRSSPPESDIELLSAYLDNQLSVAERVRLERRLGAEPALSAELEDLRGTAAALRALEPLRPPRSFALDPAKVAKPRFYFPTAWVMQLGSGLAGLALVLLASVQMLVVGAPAASPVPMAAREASAAATEAPMAMEAAPMPTMAAASTMSEAATAAPDAAASTMMEATAAPAAEAAPLPTPAATAAPAAAEPPAAGQPRDSTAAQAPAGGAGPAGAAPGGGASNSAPYPYGEPGAAGDAIQSSESSSPGTSELPAPAAPKAAPQGFPPGLTLAIGAALIGLAAVWHLYGRRRGI